MVAVRKYARTECAMEVCPFPDVCAVRDLCDQPKGFETITQRVVDPRSLEQLIEQEPGSQQLKAVARLLLGALKKEHTETRDGTIEADKISGKWWLSEVLRKSGQAGPRGVGNGAALKRYIDWLEIQKSKATLPWKSIDTASKDGTRYLLAKIVGHPDHPTALWWACTGHWSDKWNNWNDGVEPSGLSGPTHFLPINGHGVGETAASEHEQEGLVEVEELSSPLSPRERRMALEEEDYMRAFNAFWDEINPGIHCAPEDVTHFFPGIREAIHAALSPSRGADGHEE